MSLKIKKRNQTMKLLCSIMASVLLLVSVGGCAFAYPGTHTFAAVQFDVGAGGEHPFDLQGSPLDLSNVKVGTAKETNILGFYSAGDSSIVAAAQEGGITKVRYHDRKVTNVLGIWSVYTTRVYGY